MTLCTVAIPVFNRRQFVGRAIDSGGAQSVPGLEILVVDNSSTDGTWEFLQTIRGHGVRCLRNETNIGLFGNLNRCLELANGKYVRLLCSDDRLLPDCLPREIAILEGHPEVSLVSTCGWQVDARGRRIVSFADILEPGIYAGEDMIPAALWLLSVYSNPFNYPSGALLRRSSLARCGGFDSDLVHVGDLDLFLRLMDNAAIAISAHAGCEVCVHSGQESNRLLDSGDFTREWPILARRWAGALERKGLLSEVLNQTAAFSLAIAVRFARRAKLRQARIYFRAALAQAASQRALPRSLAHYYLCNARRRLGHKGVLPTWILQGRTTSGVSDPNFAPQDRWKREKP